MASDGGLHSILRSGSSGGPTKSECRPASSGILVSKKNMVLMTFIFVFFVFAFALDSEPSNSSANVELVRLANSDLTLAPHTYLPLPLELRPKGVFPPRPRSSSSLFAGSSIDRHRHSRKKCKGFHHERPGAKETRSAEVGLDRRHEGMKRQSMILNLNVV